MSDSDVDPVRKETPDWLSHMHSYDIAKLVRDRAQNTPDDDNHYDIEFEVHTAAEHGSTSRICKHYYIHAPLGSNQPNRYTASVGKGIGTIWYTMSVEDFQTAVDVAARRKAYGKMADDFVITHDPTGVMDVDTDEPGAEESWWLDLHDAE